MPSFISNSAALLCLSIKGCTKVFCKWHGLTYSLTSYSSAIEALVMHCDNNSFCKIRFRTFTLSITVLVICNTVSFGSLWRTVDVNYINMLQCEMQCPQKRPPCYHRGSIIFFQCPTTSACERSSLVMFGLKWSGQSILFSKQKTCLLYYTIMCAVYTGEV